MYFIRRSHERGHVRFDWLRSQHSFSFGHYYDPRHQGVSALRVINDDTVAPSAGFDTHGHRDMEIITYVLQGAIEHKDSMGKHHVVPAGEIQCMSAGTGVSHSEYNHSTTQALRFLQIWIEPNKKGITPRYQQKPIHQQGPLTPLVTSDGRDGSLMLQQDASVYRLQLKAGESHTLLSQQRVGYLHIIKGEATVNGHEVADNLAQGDAIGVSDDTFKVRAQSELIALWFDLPVLEFKQ